MAIRLHISPSLTTLRSLSPSHLRLTDFVTTGIIHGFDHAIYALIHDSLKFTRINDPNCKAATFLFERHRKKLLAFVIHSALCHSPAHLSRSISLTFASY
jgi:hypothetical protein